jgi:cell wall-associated NlpC family hydrolase
VRRITIILLAALSAGAARADDKLVLRLDTTLTVRSVAEAYFATTRELVLQALSHTGVRYRFGGSSPNTGFDCSGLVWYVVGRAVGVVLPRDARSLSEVGAQVSTEELQPGDLVFFNTRRRPFSHVGIYVGEQRFIHAPTEGGVVEVVDMRAQYWQQRYNGARRVHI